MGLGIVLIVWAVVGTFVAVLGASTFALVATLATRRVAKGRWPVIVAAGLFPLVCLGWGAVMLVFQGVVNESFLHRDFGLGDSWRTPLGNGYQILMIDVLDQGWVYNATTQPGSVVMAQADAVAGVRTVQVAMPYILGATDSEAFENRGNAADRVDGYFILDTRQGQRTQFQDYAHFEAGARAIGATIKLRPIFEVYSEFRLTWFDGFALVLLLLPILTGGVLLIGWIVTLRRTVPR